MLDILQKRNKELRILRIKELKYKEDISVTYSALSEEERNNYRKKGEYYIEKLSDETIKKINNIILFDDSIVTGETLKAVKDTFKKVHNIIDSSKLNTFSVIKIPNEEPQLENKINQYCINKFIEIFNINKDKFYQTNYLLRFLNLNLNSK